ncbi:MAG: response regulator transcription factor [Chitinophagaceae bacterium]
MSNLSDTATNIIIADDHQLIIDGIDSMLQGEKDYHISATASNGAEALQLISADPLKFQLLITDIDMPMMNGTELCRNVKSRYTHLPVLMLSMYSSQLMVKEAIAAEADGYILKQAGKGELLQALHRITNGGTYFSREILPVLYSQYKKEQRKEAETAVLSAREREILLLIVQEQTSEDIARQLSISKKTVDNHRAHLLEKTGCTSTVGLVKYAIRNGFYDAQ